MPLDVGIQNRTNPPPMPIEDKNVKGANIKSLPYDFSLFDKSRSASLRPFFNFQGKISSGKFSFPVQKFSLLEKDKFVFIENFPINSFPKIEIILEERNSVYEVKEFKARPSDNSVQGEILYTRFFLTTADAKICTLNFKDIDFVPFDFSFSDMALEEKKQMLYRAKLFRKLGFIENFFGNIKLNVPENITPDEAQQIEILFRGLTEGKFSNPTSSSVTVFKYKVSEEDLQDTSIPKRRKFLFEFNEDFLLFEKCFSVGKIKIKVEKGSIANPNVLKNHNKEDVLPSMRLNVFDYQVHHDFVKYSSAEKLLRNRQKLDLFKNALRKEEPKFLVKLLAEPLAELDKDSAKEIVEGLLQYYDFPDRFSVLEPKLEKRRWHVPIALTYPKYEPILLTDAFVNVRTGKIEMEISFEDLLKMGQRRSKEVFTLA